MSRAAAAAPRGRHVDPAVLLQALRGQQAVINALPYHLATHRGHRGARGRAATTSTSPKTWPPRRPSKRLADGAPVAFMPQCGLAPGFIGIVAHHLAQGFDVLHDVKMRVGALPAFPTNSLKYNLTWSVDGLINEYCHPCEAIHDGRRVDLLPLEGLEHFSAGRHRVRGLQHLAAAWARCATTLAGKRAEASTTRACATPATAR